MTSSGQPATEAADYFDLDKYRQAADDDWFDLDKYRQAAGVAYDFSKKKMEDAGGQERETIGKGAEEQRTSAEQSQRFKEKDEERDYGQAQRAYRY